eukprot:COSAG05_NODE_7697_length_778_cov_1.138439_2_plen_122_part_01
MVSLLVLCTDITGAQVQGELDVRNILTLPFDELLQSALQFVYLKRWDAAQDAFRKCVIIADQRMLPKHHEHAKDLLYILFEHNYSCTWSLLDAFLECATDSIVNGAGATSSSRTTRPSSTTL